MTARESGLSVGEAFDNWEMDFERRLLTITLCGGASTTVAMPEAMPTDTPFRRSRVDFKAGMLNLTAPGGEELTVELGSADAHEPLEGRLVVYLDQLHWVSLARQLYAPTKLSAKDADAAESLIALTRARRIVLPLSAGHLTEMAALHGRWREHLGLTVMALSRGWQMRNPVAVRMVEFVLAMRGERPRPPDVFTLHPQVLFADSKPARPPSNLPPPFDDLLPRLTWASALYAAVLDDEPVDMTEGHAAAERWAAGFPGLAQYMRDHNTSADHARLNTQARLLADLGDETAIAAKRAGLTPSQFSEWLNDDLSERLSGMPYVGRLHEVLYHRLRNADDRWERNDLIDMNFLCCAGGYADIVVGEKQTSEYLKRAASVSTPGAAICRTLPEAVEALRQLGVEV